MMISYRRLALLTALSLAAIPQVGGAQQSLGPTRLPDGAQVLINEMQQIHSQLGPMQERALQDPELREAGDSLGASIMRAMEELEPETPSLIARINELAPQIQAAQEAQDQERFVTLVTEAGEIDQLLQITRSEAAERPDILRFVEAFEDRVQSRMVSDNPSAAGLLERLEALNGQLAVLLQAAQ